MFGPVSFVAALHHVQLAMPAGEEQRARAFYAGLLGMRELQKPAPLRSRGGCRFRSGTAEVHLGIEPDFRPARKAHPAFVVGELELLRARLEAAGAAVTADDSLPWVRRFYCADPFGNRLEFIQAGDNLLDPDTRES